jgi:hypothetical protein
MFETRFAKAMIEATASLDAPRTTDQPLLAAFRPRVTPALLWGGIGFVLGALFWHLVGFWSFVSDVVLNATSSGPPVAIMRKNDLQLLARKAAAEAAKTCIKLVRNPSGGDATARACDPDDPILTHTGLGKREDPVVHASAGNWTVTAESGGRAAPGN